MEVKINKTYRHFKGHMIKVICIATNTETLKEEVIYEHLKTHQIWARDKEMFLSKVDKEKYPNATQVYRFEEVND